MDRNLGSLSAGYSLCYLLPSSLPYYSSSYSSSSLPSPSQSQSSSPSSYSYSSSSSSSPSSSSSSSFSSSSSSSQLLTSSSSSLIQLSQFKQTEDRLCYWQWVWKGWAGVWWGQLGGFGLQVSKMNIYSLKEEGQTLQQIGVVLDTPERLKLELGLIRLSELANADQLLYWGKITTTGSPYYIAVAIDFKGQYSFPHKKFYYSTDKFIFAELPALDPYNRPNANNYNNLPFTGNPQTVLQAVPEAETQPPAKNQDDSEEEEAVKVQPKSYTQEDRLAYTVNAIEQECQLVPVGAFRMATCHELRYNEEYRGVKGHQFSLASFRHFRYPQSSESKLRIESAEAIFSFELFDPIQNPYFWSAQVNTSQSFGTVRSLLWPGYIAYSFFNKSSFGGVYNGNGIKQAQLPFYI